MQITYGYHGGFAVDTGDDFLIFDHYRDLSRGDDFTGTTFAVGRPDGAGDLNWWHGKGSSRTKTRR